ncbi:MAG TPA: hypothetical protein DCY89_06755, partial [Gammaproteobacteria bacterium]|nr:hypothetical protein [Gammaproteobacteria bacterium]
ILSLEVSAGLIVALIVLGLWTWRRQRALAGTVDRLVGQMERAQKQRGGEISQLLGDRCPAEALDEAVKVCLERERALLLAVAESLRQRGDTNPSRLPSAVQALTEAAVEAGQRSVPPEDPNPEILEQNVELRETRDALANELAANLEARQELVQELADTREAFDVLDQEYRAAFERQAADKGAAQGADPAREAAPTAPLRAVTATSSANQADARPALADGAENDAEADALAPPDVDLDALAAQLEALGDEGFAALDQPAGTIESDAAPGGELIRIDEEDFDEAVAAPRMATR